MNKTLVTAPCAVCKGSGKVLRKKLQPHRHYSQAERKRAASLYRKGLSLRAIGKLMNIKSAQSVSNLIASYANTSL